MKKHSRPVVVRSASELAEELGLSGQDAIAMEFRARLNLKIVELMRASNLTHVRLAKRTKASRTRITALLNGQTMGISTDFMLRVLSALGYKTLPSFSRIRSAA